MKYQAYYSLLESIIESPSSNHFSLKTQKIIEISLTLLTILQSFRLVWKPSLEIKNSLQFIKFWNILSDASVETLFASISGYDFFALSISFLPLSLFLLTIIQFFVIVLFKKKTKTISIVIKAGNFLLDRVLMVPTLMLLLMIFKYSRSGYLYIDEVPGSLSAEILNFGDKGIAGSILSIIILDIYICLGQGCNYEISHFNTDENLRCRYLYEPDLLEKALTFLRCLLYVQVASDNYAPYLIISAFSYALQTVCYVRYMTYYHLFMNKIKIILSLEGLCFSIGFLIGYLQDSPTTIFSLTLLTQPCIILLSFSIADYVNLRIQKTSSISNKISFEHSIRPLLRSKRKIENFFIKTRKHFDETGNDFVFLIEAYYSQKILKNSMLGLNKISLFKPSFFNIFVGFHVFKATNVLKNNLEDSDGIKIVAFLDYIEQIIQKETKYILLIQKLSFQLAQSVVSLKGLKSCVRKITARRAKLHFFYEGFLRAYPTSSVAFELYGTFLVDVLNDVNLGKPILDKANIENSSSAKKKNLFSDLTNNLMLLSVDFKDIGKILYLSHPLCKLLQIPFSESQQYFLKDFIPIPFNKKHDLYMKNFIKFGETNKFFPNPNFILKTRDDYLIELEIQAEYLTIGSRTLMITLMQKPKIHREVVLLSKNGHIYQNSFKFGSCLGLKNQNYEGSNLFEMIGRELSFNSCSFLNFIDKNSNLLIQTAILLQSVTVGSFNLFLAYLVKGACETSVSIIASREKKISKTEKVFKGCEAKYEMKGLREYSEFSNSEDTNILKSFRLGEKTKKRHSLNFTKTEKLFEFLRISLILTILALFLLQVINLIYITEQVKHTSDLGSVNILGHYKYMSSYIALIAKTIKMNDLDQDSRFYNTSELLTITEELKKREKILVNNYKDWKFCSVYSAFTNGNSLIYSQNETKSISLINEMIKFTTISYSFSEKISNGSTDYNSELNYFHMNKFRLSYYEYEFLHDGLTICELAKIENLKKTVNVLFYSGIGIILIYSVTLCIMVKILTKKLNIVWRTFYKHAKHGFPALYSKLFERIKNLHKRLPNNSTPLPVFLNISRHEDFHHSFSIIIFIALGSYVLGVFVFYENLNKLLMQRVYFNSVDIDQRFNIVNLAYFMIEAVAEKDPKYRIRYDPDLFSNSLNEMNGVKDDILNTRKQYFINNIRKYFTDSAWEILFHEISNQDSFLKFGILQSYSFLVQEAQHYASTGLKISELRIFFENLKEMVKALEDTENELESSTSFLIDQQIENLMAFVLASLVLIVLSTFFVYQRFISKEKSLLHELEKFILTIPAKSYSKPCKTQQVSSNNKKF